MFRFHLDPRNVACGHRTDALDLLFFLCLTRQKIDTDALAFIKRKRLTKDAEQY